MILRHHVIQAILTVCCTVPLVSHGETYSWKDASGKIHYGDRPPAERQSGARKLPPAPVSDDVGAARKAAAERQFNEREKQAKAEEGTKKPEDPAQAKQREANCRQARSNLTALESGQIRFSTNEKGERVALDGAVRETELAKARKSVDDWCKPPAPVK